MEPSDNVPSPSFIGRLVGIVVDPIPTLTSLRERPAWLGVLLLSLLMWIGGGFLIAPIQGREQAEMAPQAKWFQMIPEAQQTQVLEDMRHPAPAKMIGNMVGAFILVGLTCAGIAGVLWLGQRVFGGSARYKSVLACIAHAAFVTFGIGALVIVPMVLAKGSFFEVALSPVAFSDAPLGSATHRLLMFFEIFWLWGTILAGLGLALVARISKALGLALAFAVYVVLWAVAYVFTGFIFGT